jgi:hypothetical protein
MHDEREKRFDRRAFVSLAMAISGAGLPVTGLANHLLGMEEMTLRRHVWMTAHNVLALMFTFFALWHVTLNRRALVGHIRGLARRAPAVRREAVYALGVVAAVTFVVVSHAFHVR